MSNTKLLQLIYKDMLQLKGRINNQIFRVKGLSSYYTIPHGRPLNTGWTVLEAAILQVSSD